MINENILNNIEYVNNNGLKYVQFPNLTKYNDIITHAFSTRIGGVSSGECTSLNLGFNRNDSRENVLENYKRISIDLGIDYNNMVFSNQVHDNKVKIVDTKDRGKGITKPSDIKGYDGLITNSKEVALVTFYADCVPLFFFDPKNKVIALAHSGWRSTLKEIGFETVKTMQEQFDTRFADIEAVIGPSIGLCCFEVGTEVYEEFKNNLNWSVAFCKKMNEEKYNIDLQGIIKQTLVNSGLLETKINSSQTCTKCNKDIFFSHRGDNGKTGSLAAIMQLL